MIERCLQQAGGVERVIAHARQAFDAGDLRWAAEVFERAVHADDDHPAAREPKAKTREQMGCMAEAST